MASEKSEVPDVLPLKPFDTTEIDQGSNIAQGILHQTLHEIIRHMQIEFGITAFDVCGALRSILSNQPVTATRCQYVLIESIKKHILDHREGLNLTSVDVIGVVEAMIFDIMMNSSSVIED